MNLMRNCTVLYGRSSLRKSLFAATVRVVALGLFSCNPWGELNNPADIKSDKYQGFEISATADGIKSYSPANGVTLTDPPVEFVVSLVTGAKVVCENLGEIKGPKLIHFRMRRRKSSRRKRGHRQPLLRLLVKEIKVG